MAFHAVRHITEQELDETYHFEDKQTQQFFKWSNTYMASQRRWAATAANRTGTHTHRKC
jgi:hypothetical protein